MREGRIGCVLPSFSTRKEPLPNYPADPGGQFASDVHRRVLGYLTGPDERQAWTLPALFSRMVPDIGTDLQSPAELRQVLDELIQDMHARMVDTPDGSGFQMTPEGFNLLTGPAAELGLDKLKGEAVVHTSSPISESASQIGGGENEGGTPTPGTA